MMKQICAAGGLALALSACSTTPDTATTDDPYASDPFAEEPSDAAAFGPSPLANSDPWEGFNRQVWKFNDLLDRYLLKPAAITYKTVTPDPVMLGIANFFDNLGEISNGVNSVLQWKWGGAANATGRLLVNSTVGLVGFFDVAQKMGLEKTDGEDFGQTLGVWGFASGPYVVLPLLGPYTVRDGLALPVNWYTDPVTYIENDTVEFVVKGVRLVSDRAGLLSKEELISGDRYSFVRDAYLQNREYLVKDGHVEDTFGQDIDDSDDYRDPLDDIQF